MPDKIKPQIKKLPQHGLKYALEGMHGISTQTTVKYSVWTIMTIQDQLRGTSLEFLVNHQRSHRSFVHPTRVPPVSR